MKLRMGLTLRITLVFVIFTDLLLTGIGFLSYDNGRSALEAAAVSELHAVAIAKEFHISSWVDGQISDVESFANSPDLRNVVMRLTTAAPGSPLGQSAHDDAVTLLQTLTLHSSHTQFLMAVVDPVSGQIIAATDPAIEKRSLSGEPYFRNAISGTYVYSPQTSEFIRGSAMVIGTPLLMSQGKALGVLISWVSYEPINNALLHRSGLHHSDEVYLVNPDHEFVTQPRLKKVTAGPIGKVHTPSVELCLAGNSGLLLGRDYRGIPAIIVYRWLPKYKLCLIDKINQDEAFASVREFGWTIALITFFVLFGTTLLGIGLARTITRPLLALQAGVSRFGRGELNVRLPATSKDELGQLAHEFNNMAAAIAEKELQLRTNAEELEQRVQERTKTLQQQADLLELAHDAIIVRDLQGVILFWNRGAAALYGWTAVEAAGQITHTLLQTQFPVSLDDLNAALLDTGYWGGELKHKSRDGRRMVVASRQAMHYDENGQPAAILEINTDITEHKRAQEELDRFYTLSLDLLCIASFDGYFKRLNPAWSKVLGYTEAELTSVPFVDFVHPEDLDATVAVAQKLSGGDEVISFENRYRCKNGSYRWLLWQAVPAVGYSLIYAAAHDITERKVAEEQLQQSKEKAEAATRAKSEFLANMSHEIRTPMNGVIGLTNLVLKTPLSSQQHEYLTLIKSSADSLMRLLNDILDFSKMEARKLELDIIEFDLRELVGNTLKAFSASANEKGLELTYQVTPDLPDFLLGDPGRLAQIIVNLVGNALKFTKGGEVVVRVAQESREERHALLRFSITDTGIGILKEEQAYIFNAFAQADSSTTRHFGGTGLGLAIVSQLVSLMGGEVRVESEPGKGTTFHFTARLGIPQQSANSLMSQVIVLKDLPVLVVDDNRTNRLILEELLKSWGLKPILVDGAEKALVEMRRAQASGTPFPLALLDSKMPEVDGFQLVERITVDPAFDGVTIMMLSSSDVSGEIKLCKALNVARYLRKPIKQSELFNEIVSALGLAQAVRLSTENRAGIASSPPRILNILVAEDHPINQTLMVEILKERGHAFSIANNGLEVLKMLEQQTFDVILMDGQMPEMDGYQATAEIRRREASTGKHIRIIAVTANAMKQDREICLAAGMDDYISKPIDPDLLLEKLEMQLDTTPYVLQADPKAELPAVDKTFDLDGALKRARGKPALLKQMVELFLRDLSGTLAAVQEAVDEKNPEGLVRSAHRLRGAAMTLGAEALVQAAVMLESAGKSGCLDSAPAAMRELHARASELVTEMNNFIGDA